MRGRGAQCVERAEVVGLGRTAEHVAPRGVAGELHVGGGGSAQQVGDELELLDGTRGLEEGESRFIDGKQMRRKS